MRITTSMVERQKTCHKVSCKRDRSCLIKADTKSRLFKAIPAVRDKYSDTVRLCKHLLVPPGKKKIPHQQYVIFIPLYMPPSKSF